MTKTTAALSIHTLTVGQLAANCYLLQHPHSRKMLVIDPGEDANYIAERITKLDGKPMAILATHGHFDHILGAGELQMMFGIPFYIHEMDTFLVSRMRETAKYFLSREIVESPPTVDGVLTHGQRLPIEDTVLTVVSSPGHTPGSVCFHDTDNGMLFSGDTIFAKGAVGRTDFSYADKKVLDNSLNKIFSFPPKTIIYPGHGKPSTLQAEKTFHMVSL